MDHQVVLSEPIFLQSGFDDLVNFTLHGGKKVHMNKRVTLLNKS